MLLSTGPPSLVSKLAQLLALIGIIGLFLHTSRLYEHRQYSPVSTVDLRGTTSGISAEDQYLSRIAERCGLTNVTSWMTWRISSTEQSYEWQSVTDVKHNFQSSSSSKIVDMTHPNNSDIRAKKRMNLPVPQSPRPGTVDASDLLFGISTTFERVRENDFAMIKTWARWLTTGRHGSNGASLVVMLDRALTQEVDMMDAELAKYGIDAYVTTTEEPMSLARRYYELARILKTFGVNLVANGQHKRWFALIEDNVFFPSLSYLLDRLYGYNSDEQLYVGLPSERADWERLDRTITTYGGGAIFLTRSAIAEIPRLPCFSKQTESGLPIRAKGWDMLLQDCITKYTNLNMHVLPGFYSPKDELYFSDIDSYESGLQPLLLHHPKGRHNLDVTQAHLVTDVCGESCFMQRYKFHDNWVLVNGVSITEYPNGVQFEHPKDAEGAALDDEEYGSQQSPKQSSRISTPRRVVIEEEVATDKPVMTWKGDKRVWTLVDSVAGKNGAVWQAYVKRANLASKKDTERIDSVIVLIWEAPGMFTPKKRMSHPE